MNNLAPTMESALKRFQETGSVDGIRPQTIRALERRGVIELPQKAAESYAVPRQLTARFIDVSFSGRLPKYSWRELEWSSVAHELSRYGQSYLPPLPVSVVSNVVSSVA